jgi:hypothetical protein
MHKFLSYRIFCFVNRKDKELYRGIYHRKSRKIEIYQTVFSILKIKWLIGIFKPTIKLRK